MRPTSKGIAKAFHALVTHANALRQENSSLDRECAQVNLNRILYCAWIAMPVNLALVIAFGFIVPGNAAETAWRTGIMWSHATLILLLGCFATIAWKLRHTGRVLSVRILQLTVAASLLGMGVVIAAIDQLVTTNITPFLLVCMIVGALFLIRPVVSASLFAASFAAFYIAINTASNPDVLMSNRVNALAAAAIGFGLSLAMWRHFSVEIRQRRQIEAQSGELERINRELQNMAFTDSLTGLPNRRYFDQAVARELAAIERGGPSAAVIEFDLDYFKEINDTRGHAVGDEMLRQLARLVSGAIRRSDMFARYGGEEFILLLPVTTLEGAEATAEKLRGYIEEQVFLADGQEIRLTASFGVAALDKSPAISCYRSVDRALYRAKKLGRNRVEIMSPDDPESLSTVADIAKAV